MTGPDLPIALPRRGQIYLVSLGAARGGEPGKTRPAVVVSSDDLPIASPRDLVIVVPVSSSMEPSGLRIELPDGAGMDRPSRAICRALRSVAVSRLQRSVGWVDAATLNRIDDAIALILGR